MRRFRDLIIVAAVVALALSSIGAPVSAAGKGKIAFVNGWPGKIVDLCINNREVKSNVRYGQIVYRTLSGGFKTFKVYKKDPRSCRGQLLGKQSFGLPGGSDHTIVLTRFAPRILNFDNEDFGAIVPGNYSQWFWRNASDIPSVSLDLDFDFPTPGPTAPAVDPPWTKGDQFFFPFLVPPGSLLVATTAWSIADTLISLGKPDARLVENLVRYEWIIVGTNQFNARHVLVQRAVPPIS